MYKYWIHIGILFSLFSCTESTHPEDDTIESYVSNESAEMTTPNAFTLIQNTCTSCHSLDFNGDNSSGPRFASIKESYIKSYPNQEDFVKELSDFIVNPTKERALMQEAVDSFGVMPIMGLGEEQAVAIAKYLFEQDVQSEFWYTNEFQTQKAMYSTDFEELSYLERGMQFAMATKSVLGKNLKGKIKAHGTDAALEFCQLNAVPIVDSMQNALHVGIKRVSDKNRNPNNVASNYEKEVINRFKSQLAKNEEVIGETREFEEYVEGYYPILTNQMCLQCHGGDSDISESTKSLLSKLYPNDLAVSYSVNELRGVWVVRMGKKL